MVQYFRKSLIKYKTIFFVKQLLLTNIFAVTIFTELTLSNLYLYLTVTARAGTGSAKVNKVIITIM